MTDPDAVAVAVRALADAGILVSVEHRRTLVDNAVAILQGRATRDGALDRLEAAIPIDRRYLAKLLDLSVEALTAQE